MNGITVERGHLFFFFAYDVGFDISLADARRLAEAEESPGLAGLRPAPPHLQYRRGGSRPGHSRYLRMLVSSDHSPVRRPPRT